MSALYCLGEVRLTLSPADPADALAQAELFRVGTGGSAAEICAGYARLGGHAVLLTQLGEDTFGHRLEAELRKEGVDTSRIRFSREQHTPVLFSDFSAPLAYHGAELAFPPETLDPSFLKDASVLHISSTILLDGSSRYTCLKAIAAAREAGVPISFAPCLEPFLWADAAFLRQTFFQFLPLVDLVFLTESELEFLFGSPELRTALFALFTGHVQFIACTGRQGTRLLTRNLLRQSEAACPLTALCADILYQLAASGLSRKDLPRWDLKTIRFPGEVLPT